MQDRSQPPFAFSSSRPSQCPGTQSARLGQRSGQSRGAGSKRCDEHEPLRARKPERGRRHQLSKSRYMAGLQCPKRLWWQTHEPDAPELVPDAELQARFDSGHRIGELARAQVPGGVLIDLPYWQVEQRLAATERALRDGVPVIYEASFLQDGIFVAIDVLSRVRNGFALTEVKSTLDVKDTHIPDVAVQLHVAAKAGLAVRRAELMHLNRECRHPHLSKLFTRQDVTAQATLERRKVPRTAARLIKMLAGPQPQREPGDQCSSPHRCPFFDRCHPVLPEQHISTLYRIHRNKLAALEAEGVHSLHDLDVAQLPDGLQRRQVESVQRREVVVGPGLRAALAGWSSPMAFLDLETISPAVPAWRGCRPYQPVPVQMSCHVLSARKLTHFEWLASRSSDPREGLARAVLSACAGARTVVTYNASFERSRLLDLAAALPKLRRELQALAGRLTDLLQVVRDHVYHPAFGGSFSLKSVLPALVPKLSYEGLTIANGTAASCELERLLVGTDEPDASAKETTRRALLAYCGRDTLGMVRIYQWLRTQSMDKGACALHG